MSRVKNLCFVGCSGLQKHNGVVIVKRVYYILWFEDSFAPILPHAIQTINSKTCVKRSTATAKSL